MCIDSCLRVGEWFFGSLLNSVLRRGKHLRQEKTFLHFTARKDAKYMRVIGNFEREPATSYLSGTDILSTADKYFKIPVFSWIANV